MRLLILKKHSIRLLMEKNHEICLRYGNRDLRINGGLCCLFDKHNDIQWAHGDMHHLLHGQ